MIFSVNIHTSQLPFLFGVPILEKLVAPVAPLFIGRTGSQLFLTDDKPNKPSLLLRMTSDCEDGKFMYVEEIFFADYRFLCFSKTIMFL